MSYWDKRRKEARFDISVPIIVRANTSEAITRTQDFSGGGCAIALEDSQLFSIGDSLELSFELPEGNKTLMGMVRWSVCSKHGALVGIQFEESLSNEEFEELLREAWEKLSA